MQRVRRISNCAGHEVLNAGDKSFTIKSKEMVWKALHLMNFSELALY